MPLSEVSRFVGKESKIGSISSLHTWWARRPSVISRVTAFASLADLPEQDEKRSLLTQQLTDLCTLHMPNSKEHIIEDALAELASTWKGTAPKVLDPFAGGGSIPLELLRLGAETFCNDINPVAAFIQKAALEWPIRFRTGTSGLNSEKSTERNPRNSSKGNLLSDLVREFATVIESRVRTRIGQYYDESVSPGSSAVAYFWTKIFPCPNSECGSEIPLLRHFYLASRGLRRIFLYPSFEGKKVVFELRNGDMDEFDPGIGTVRLGRIRCLNCDQVAKSDVIRKLALRSGLIERLVAVGATSQEIKGRQYRLPTSEDIFRMQEAGKAYESLKKSWRGELSPIPDEFVRTPQNKPLESEKDPFFVHLQIVNYGVKSWGDLFNPRQKLVVSTFLQALHEVEPEIRAKCSRLEVDSAEELFRIVIGYLGIILDR
ncbi:MAG TPA: DUF1156 domain-containing protein, partial [Candidatus Hodarchaeales archaeon]|nr:DUF1156 domain-containing protein [Candidatus Hodarchaeales archaeon]